MGQNSTLLYYFVVKILMIFKKMPNNNSTAYKIGRVVGRILIITAGLLVGKRLGRRPIDQFPKKKIKIKRIIYGFYD